MKHYEHQTWVLITRVLTGETDAAEEEKFQQWLKEDPANRQFFHDLEVYWREEPHGNAVNADFLFNYESGLNKLRSRIRKEKQRKRTHLLHASVNRNRFFGWKIAASIVLLIAVVSVFGVRHFWTQPVTSYATSAMEQRIITLPDGSTVRLNKNLEIAFAKGFAGSARKVTLTGEAFFQVRHNADKPFIIHAGDAVIRDIGTSFNVKEERNGEVVVAVKEGIASLRSSKASKDQAAVLKRDQIGIMDKGRLTAVKQISIQNYLSWINGQIVFKKTPFDEVTRQLENIYGIHCEMADSSLSALKLTAYIKNTSLHDVLHMIALSLDIHYRKKGDKIVWMNQQNTPDRHLQPKQETN